MKILFITRKWPPAMGGMETYSAELVAGLSREDDVTCRALPGGADGSAPGVLAVLWFALRTAVSVLFGRGGYDVVHGGDMAVWPLVALAGLRSRGARQVLSAHGTDVSYGFRSGRGARLYRAYAALGARVMRRAHVAANSRATADLAEALGYDASRIAVIPLASRVAPQEAGQVDTNQLLFAGRLVTRKGLLWFVNNVLPELPEGIELAVAGTPWDPSENAALGHPRVRYLGRVAPEALHGLMAKALAVVIPNITETPGVMEGFGLVAVEAAAAGGVVLAADVSGFRDSVIDGKTGLLLPASAPRQWVEAIGKVAGWSPAERAAWTDTAQKTAAEQFNWDRVCTETRALYEKAAQ